MSKIWIELDRLPVRGTTPDECATFAAEQCRLANNMLARLADPVDLPLRDTFFWSEHERVYCYGGHNGYVTLPDNGHWLNLDYLGRPLPEPKGLPGAFDPSLAHD